MSCFLSFKHIEAKFQHVINAMKLFQSKAVPKNSELTGNLPARFTETSNTYKNLIMILETL